jgi:hypothetical protein
MRQDEKSFSGVTGRLDDVTQVPNPDKIGGTYDDRC